MDMVQLTGSAVHGIGPDHAMAAVAALSVSVCLGRKPPDKKVNPLQFYNYFDFSALSAPLPTSINRRNKAAASIARMYRNDVKGCCVISGKLHALGLWSANDSDAGGIVVAQDSEVDSEYTTICGPGDNGCVISRVLDVMVVKGLLAGGKRWKIDGYVSADWTNKMMVQAVQCVFGATSIGINLPQAWTQNAIWDVTSSPIVGGHDVTPIDYDDKGVYVASWGRIYLITWAAFMSRRWLEEYWAILAPLWYGKDGVNSATGIDLSTLQADMVKVKNGMVPDVESPPPPPPSGKRMVTLALDDTTTTVIGDTGR